MVKSRKHVGNDLLNRPLYKIDFWKWMRRKKKTFLPECFIRTIKCKRQIMLMSRRVKVDMNWTHLLQTFQYNNGVLYLVEGRLLFFAPFFPFTLIKLIVGGAWLTPDLRQFHTASASRAWAAHRRLSLTLAAACSGSTYAAQIDLSFLSSYFFFFYLMSAATVSYAVFLPATLYFL